MASLHNYSSNCIEVPILLEGVSTESIPIPPVSVTGVDLGYDHAQCLFFSARNQNKYYVSNLEYPHNLASLDYHKYIHSTKCGQ